MLNYIRREIFAELYALGRMAADNTYISSMSVSNADVGKMNRIFRNLLNRWAEQRRTL
jgi:hypothetical protein